MSDETVGSTMGRIGKLLQSIKIEYAALLALVSAAGFGATAALTATTFFSTPAENRDAIADLSTAVADLGIILARHEGERAHPGAQEQIDGLRRLVANQLCMSIAERDANISWRRCLLDDAGGIVDAFRNGVDP